MRSTKKWHVTAASFLLLLCAAHSAPPAAAQVSCTVTYNCHGSSGCASLFGGQITQRTVSVASPSECNAGAAKVGDGSIASCSCSGGGTSAGSSTVAPAAPGHEFDDTIHQAISAGLSGKISAGNAAGFVGLGLLGNALFAPKTTTPAQQQQQQQLQQQRLQQQQLNLEAKQLNNSGIFLFKNGNYSGAINEFQQALAKTPNDPNIRHNLEMAKQKLHESAIAGQTSGALGQLLGTAPPTGGNSNGVLNLVNIDSDPNIVDLRGTTNTAPESLKGQLDVVFGNSPPGATPNRPFLQQQAHGIDDLFQPSQSQPSQQQEAEQSQVDNIFNDHDGAANTDPLLRDALADTHPPQGAPPPPDSNTDGNGKQATPATGTNAFGIPNANPSSASGPMPTDLRPANAAAPGSDVDASHQVKVTAGSSIQALGRDQEAGAKLAGQPFDSGGDKSYGDSAPVVSIARPGAAPAASSLAAHIPVALRNDQAIQNGMAYYQRLENQKSDAQAKLAAVQQQIDSGTGDAQVLNAQKATLTNNLNQYNTDQANTQAQVKKIVVSHNLPWNEDSQPPTPLTPTTNSTPATNSAPAPQ